MPLKPIERPVYVHHLIGGLRDGDRVPSGRAYKYLTVTMPDGKELFYVWDGQAPERHDGDDDVGMLMCDGSYAEPAYFKVRLVLSHKRPPLPGIVARPPEAT